MKELAIKILIQLSIDEEKRKKALIFIISVVTGLLMLIAFFLYLITNPLDMFKEFIFGNEILAIEQFQKDYGYNQSIGIYDKDYIEGSGQDYGDITFTDSEISVVYFNQLDEKYKNQLYGTDKVGTHGCGPTSMAIVVSSLTGQIYDPIYMCNWSVENGYYAKGSGSYHSLIPNCAKAFGLNAEGLGNDKSKVVDALNNGKLVVALMSKGTFTNSGHFIVLRGITSEGKILVADPASYKRSKQQFDIDLIINEARKGAGAGGAFWSIWN